MKLRYIPDGSLHHAEMRDGEIRMPMDLAHYESARRLLDGDVQVDPHSFRVTRIDAHLPIDAAEDYELVIADVDERRLLREAGYSLREQSS